MTITNSLYKLARLSADMRAVRKGPKAITKRLIRKKIYAKQMGMSGKILRRIGL